MCICHLPCRPVKPNLVGDQVKMLNHRNSCHCTKWGNWVTEGNFWDLFAPLCVMPEVVGPGCVVEPMGS